MPHIRQQVLIAAPAATVFDALTTQQGLSNWWTPHAQAQPLIDGTARFPFSSGYAKQMRIIELNRPSLVKWLCIAGADEWIDTTVRFMLHGGTAGNLLVSHPEMEDQVEQQLPFDQATIVSLQHDTWTNYTPMFAECTYTWGRFLRSLKSYCQTGEGMPWPHQHKL